MEKKTSKKQKGEGEKKKKRETKQNHSLYWNLFQNWPHQENAILPLMGIKPSPET